MINGLSQEQCTGCSACMQVCPVKCISMCENEEGFLYPQIGSSCIECSKCERVCPIINQTQVRLNVPQKAYASRTKKYDVWKKSASGGAFLEICRAWDDGKTVFVGAAWDGFKVKHVCVDSIKDAEIFCKSKYISSDLENSFSDIKKVLESGNKVVFSGTPCQVNGLKAFLGKEYEKLLLIDIICHGVGSPKVFETCIQILEKQFNITIKKYGFRYKKRYYVKDHIQCLTLDNGNRMLIQNDPYMQLFISQDCLRESCGKNCIYRNESRQGDITIGDFKHLNNIFPLLRGSKYNYSTIVLNNIKSQKLYKKLYETMEMRECNVSDIAKYNPIFARHTYFSKKRDLFFGEYVENPVKTIKKWTQDAQIYKQSFKSKVFGLLPTFIRKKIIKSV